MYLQCESTRMSDYLARSELIDFDHPAMQNIVSALAAASSDAVSYTEAAFLYVRDQIAHSWDIQSKRVACCATDVLLAREGICYAKANLLCALLRAHGIPAGFCYQLLTLGDTPDTGHVIHALNGVYIAPLDKWIRLDARGNKPGVDAQFSLTEEKLAFPIRPHYGEREDWTVYTKPRADTIDTLQRYTDCIVMYQHGLPSQL